MCSALVWSWHRAHACSTVVAEQGCIPGLVSWASCEAAIITEDHEVPPVFVDYGHEQMEPKTGRMCLPQWDGDPSGWRDYQQEVRHYKTGENLERQLVRCSATGWRTQKSSTTSRSGDDWPGAVAHSAKHHWQLGTQGWQKPPRHWSFDGQAWNWAWTATTTEERWKPWHVLCFEQAQDETWRAHHGLHHQVRGGY